MGDISRNNFRYCVNVAKTEENMVNKQNLQTFTKINTSPIY